MLEVIRRDTPMMSDGLKCRRSLLTAGPMPTRPAGRKRHSRRHKG